MITYGNGEVIGLENIQGFDIKYKGSIEIDPAQDNWIIQANKNRIIGICLNQTSSALLFTYTGELRILSAKYVQNNEQHRSRITLQGVDFWGLDREKWEDDGSLWGTRNGTYLVGSKKRKTTIKNLENGVSKVPVHDIPSQSLPNHIVPKPPLVNTYSLNFDGSDDYVDIGNSDVFSFGDGSNDSAFSMSAWIKMDDATNFAIINKGVFNTDGEWNFRTNASDKLVIALYDESVSSCHQSLVSDSAITSHQGSWINVVATYDGSGGALAKNGLTLYLNGAVLASATASLSDYVAMENLSGNVYIGKMSSNYANGNIDEVAVWNTVLDADAITSIYNSGTPTDLNSDSGDYDNSSNLQGYWRMGDGTLDTYPLIADQTNAILGSDLLQKGNPIDNNGDWTAQTGWTADASNEKLTGSSTTGNIYATSTTSFSNGDILEVTFTVANYSSGSVRFIVGGNTNGTARSANGTYIEYVKVSSAVNTLIYIDGVLSFTGDIKGITVKKVQGNAGLMTNMVSGDIEEDTP